MAKAPREWRADLRLNGAVFASCIKVARQCLGAGDVEEALRWAAVAARCATKYGIGAIASPDLETFLLEIARTLPSPAAVGCPSTGSKARWLHILDEAHAIGGHTALARRWIELDPEPNTHSVLVLSSRLPIPDVLELAVRRRGGRAEVAPVAPSLLTRARTLRERVWASADVVVLHTHPDSVVPAVALGVPGGPPVILLNHVGHGFWVGGAVADLVLNLRRSTLRWTAQHRAISRNGWLPIPIAATFEGPGQDARAVANARARRFLGLPPEAPILLTIGSSYKYRPYADLDFFKVAQTLLDSCPAAHLVAVGPVENHRWRTLREASGGRVHVVGPQLDLSPYHAVVDVYLEGFPVGSPTALLEVALHGVACVRAPRAIPPPFVFDGLEQAGLEQPAGVADYVDEVIRLLGDPSERQHRGEVLARSVREVHVGDGWQRHLHCARQALPSSHHVYPVNETVPLDGRTLELSVALSPLSPSPTALSGAWEEAARLGLNPHRMRARSLQASLLGWSLTARRSTVKREAALMAQLLCGPRLWPRIRQLAGGQPRRPPSSGRSPA